MTDTVTAALPMLIGGRYEVLGVIGRGAMGTVYRARHTLTQRLVAVKVLHPELERSRPLAVERLIREAQATASIPHRALPLVLDAGRADGEPSFVVFELLDGRTLRDALAAGDISARRLVEIMAEVLDALQMAHARGVIHRDIKPANVFISHDAEGREQVKLLDFGIAKLRGEGLQELTGLGQVLGTVVYMSPEQARGREVTAASDLWSVGVVLYEGLSGRVPIKDATPLKTLESIAQAGNQTLHDAAPQLSPELIAVVDRALAPTPAARWTSAGQMRRALLDAMAIPSPRVDPTVDATLPGAAELRSLAHSGARLTAVAVVLVLIGAIGTIGAWWAWASGAFGPEAVVAASSATAPPVVAAERGTGESPAPTEPVASAAPEPASPMPAPATPAASAAPDPASPAPAPTPALAPPAVSATPAAVASRSPTPPAVAPSPTAAAPRATASAKPQAPSTTASSVAPSPSPRRAPPAAKKRDTPADDDILHEKI